MIVVYGPYLRKDGRKHIVIYNTETKHRRTQSYPRYLLEQYLGRELEKEETVDHIDEDFTNDVISNLQILSRIDNVKKSSYINGTIYVCAAESCNNRVWRSVSQAVSKRFIFCSNSCRSKTYRNQYQINSRVAQLAEAPALRVE